MSASVISGRRTSSLRTNWIPSTRSTGDQPMAGSLDKFPEFEESPMSTTDDPNSHLTTPTIRHPQEDYWQPRKNGHVAWDHPNGVVPHSSHRPRKSIGETIASLRTRNASVAVNAHELADALKAPVSYKLIVSRKPLPILELLFLWGLTRYFPLCPPGYVYHLVHDLSSHQYLLEIDLKHSSTPHYSHRCPICLRSCMVFIARICRIYIP